MTETQKRIKAYQKALPYMKERVMAVALLFVMSISMMASATFAWVTLSRSPQISGLATTVATNGNLEIALSDKDGLEPDPTSPTDGGGDITQTNLKWGNLINLSHNSYGLSNLTLRPAVLNSGSLLTEPLYSVQYHSDGRISGVVSDFAYTNYEKKGEGYAFTVPEGGKTEYGVRAISSVTYASIEGDAALLSLNTALKQAYSEADNAFKTLWNNKDYMNSITGMAGVYLQYRIKDTDQDCTSYVKLVYDMYNDYKNCLYLTGETLVAAANVYHFVYCNQNEQSFTPFTIEDLHSGAVKTTLTAEGVKLEGLDAYLADHKTFNGTEANGYTDGLYSRFYTNVYEPYTKNTSIGWELMRDYINPMADINSATIDGTAASAIGASEITSLAGSNPVCELQKGLVWNMDWFYGGNISVTGVSAKVNYIITVTVNIKEIRTSAKAKVEDVSNTKYTNYPIIEVKNQAIKKAEEGGLKATDAVAADTYGMVVDFWLRTNAADTLLALAGKVNTKVEQIYDSEGNPVTDEEGNPVTETVVIGYSGENRIWEEDDELSALGPSTSQGSGSCYIFYPETPEDQAQALEMLSAMRIAFVDEEGNLLAQADMDTSMAFEQEGRVLVPLQLRAKSIVTGTDEEGNPIVENAYYITKMVQNEATRITAIVYLDGARLENSNVLASGSIKGQLNIQFGTSDDLDSMDDRDLMDDFYNIMITADKTEFDSFDPDNKPQVKLNLALTGMEASSIKGQFVSYISETQGANQPEFDFVKTDNGWEATVTFDGSGSFKLRSIRIDGVDYALKEDQIITVEIPGITINNIICEGWEGKNSKTLMTAENFYQLTTTLSLNISAGNNPSKVQAVFAHDQGQNITVDYVQTNSGWVANTIFTTSGNYTLTYVIIDDVYIPLPASLQKSLKLYLGLKAQVFLSQPMTTEYQTKLAAIEDAEDAEIAEYKAANPDATDEEVSAAIATIQAKYKPQKDALYDQAYGEDGLNMTVSTSGYSLIYDGSEPLYMNVSCIITDDKGNAMTGLNDVVLHYGVGSSLMNRIDTNLTWNSSIGRYEGATEGEGRFKITRPGSYGFQNVEIGKGEDKNIITVALSAPKVTAISPVPMEYVGAASTNQAELVEINNAYSNINDTTKQRLMTVQLKHASAATVIFEIYNKEEDKTYEFEGVAISTNETTGISYFVPTYKQGNVTGNGLPYDGTWTITGMKVANVFYDDVYYDGDTVTEGATGYLDLGEFLAADTGVLTTRFFTTVKFSAINAPALIYNGAFMDDHIVDNMRITITDHFGNAIEGIDVDLAYQWDGTNRNFTVTDMNSLPNQSFTIAEIEAGKVFKMETMNFQLEGEYKLNFSVTIGGTTYTELSAFVVDGSFSLQPIPVNWSIPTVSIESISPSGSHKTVNKEAETEYNVTSSFSGKTVEIYCKSKIANRNITYETYPSVTLKINGLKNASSAQLLFTANGGTVYMYPSEQMGGTRTDAYEWTSDGTTCQRFVGQYKHSATCSNAQHKGAGVLTASKLTLVHNGISYTFNVSSSDAIVIKNEQ